MPGPSNTLLIEGSFTELAEEIAQYIDAISKTDAASGVHAEIAPSLNEIREKEQAEDESTDSKRLQTQKDDILKKIVGKAAVLNSAPEKEFTAAYNLLIHLSNQSGIRDILLNRICQYLSEQPVTSSPQFGSALALSTLATIFNTLPISSESRYHVFLAILKVIRKNSSAQAFDVLIPQLKTNIPNWLVDWQLDDEEARTLYTAVADVATASRNDDIAYDYLLHALETIPPASASEEESRALARRTLHAAILNPSVTDFTPITASDAIQALRKSDPSLFELLEIFSSDDYATYSEFLESTPLSSLSLPTPPHAADPERVLSTKIRLLALATIAANSPTRSVSYTQITHDLQIPASDVEMWVIDAIRAGLVEGKLSQLKQEFLVQRATYRVFGEKQWAEVQGRLMVWRRSLESVLGVIRNERERFAREGPGPAAGVAQPLAQGVYSGRKYGYGGGGGGGGGGDNRDRRQGGGGGNRGGRGQHQREPREPREPRQPREVEFGGGAE